MFFDFANRVLHRCPRQNPLVISDILFFFDLPSSSVSSADGSPSSGSASSAVGGVVVSLAAAASGSYAIVGAPDGTTSLESISASGQVETVAMPSDRAPTAVASCGDGVHIAYTNDAGVWVYDTASGAELNANAIDIGGQPIGAGALECGMIE